MSEDKQQLANLLTQSFNVGERLVLLRRAGVNPEEIAAVPTTAAEHAWAIVDYFERRGQLSKLSQAIREERADPAASAPPPDAKGSSDHAAPQVPAPVHILVSPAMQRFAKAILILVVAIGGVWLLRFPPGSTRTVRGRTSRAQVVTKVDAPSQPPGGFTDSAPPQEEEAGRGGLGTNTYSYIALLVFILCASYLYYRQAYLNKLDKLPPSDRLVAIRDLNPRVPDEIGAQEWLASRRQSFVFWAYGFTVLAAIVVVSVMLGRVRIPPNEPARSFHVLDWKFESYERVARDVYDRLRQNAPVVAQGGESGEQAEKQIADAINAYNPVIGNLLDGRQKYVDDIMKWVPNRPDLEDRITGPYDYLVDDIHKEHFLKIDDLRAALEAAKQDAPMRQKGARPKVVDEIVETCSQIEKDFEKLDKKLAEFRAAFAPFSVATAP